MNREKFISCLETLLYSWGSDAPSEAVWAGNEFLEFFEEEENVKIPYRFSENLENFEENGIKYIMDSSLIFDEIRKKRSYI